jgi:hypothetical protein
VRSARLLLAAVLLAAPAGVAVAATTGDSLDLNCYDQSNEAKRVDFTVDGQQTWALYAAPSTKAPTGVVVFDHGYGNTPYSWEKHLRDVAARDNVIAVAPHYHGEVDSPTDPMSSRGWRVAEGAADTIRIAQLVEAHCSLPAGSNTVYGVSMGGNTSGLVAMQGAKRADGKPVFDYWFAIEPAVNVTETYHEASLVAQSGNTYAANARDDIEAEMGGTFAEQPQAYLDRTVVAHAAEIAHAGLKGVVVVQGADDGLVPYNQSRELVSQLRALQVPIDDVTVGTRGSGEPGTTLDGSFVPAPGYESPFAGHAWEGSDTQLVGVTGFDLLDNLYLHGDAPKCRESLRDGDTGQWLVGPATC